MIYERIDADLIRHAAKNTNGAAGPWGLDAHGWRRICCTFKQASDELCHSLALLFRRLCTQFIHTSAMAPILACRLIILDKNPGVRPIGVCEVDRIIIPKAILFIIKGDIQEATDAIQRGVYTGFLPRGGRTLSMSKRGGARLFVAAGQPQGGGCRKGM